MKSMTRINYCYLIIIITRAVLVVDAQFYEYKEVGSHCQNNGIGGICKKVEDCIIALKDIRKRGTHDLSRCTFEGLDEIVCCPIISERGPIEVETTTIDPLSIWSISNGPPRPRSPQRKAEQMCEEYIKTSGVKPPIEFHIINGQDAKDGEFPHMAALYFRGQDNEDVQFRCGGSLISLNYVLSAAHCFECASCTKLIKVRLGVINRNNPAAIDMDVENTTVHPLYSYASNHNDIALVKLVKNIKITKTLFPACLYLKNDNPEGLIISGWGTTDVVQLEQTSIILQKTKIHPVSIHQCNKTILAERANTLKVILNTQICAIENGTDSCAGDSGGPLQIERRTGGYDIVGIVSWGISCASTIPGVYTRVSAYLDFIEEIVWPD